MLTVPDEYRMGGEGIRSIAEPTPELAAHRAFNVVFLYLIQGDLAYSGQGFTGQMD